MMKRLFNTALASMLVLNFTGCALAQPAATTEEPEVETTTVDVDTAADTAKSTSDPISSVIAGAAERVSDALSEPADVMVEEYAMAEADMVDGGMVFNEPMASVAMSTIYEPEESYVQYQEFNTEEYDYQEENPFMSTSASPLSTFAADVDTASYANLRRQILDYGYVTPDSARIEEMVNYFHYNLPEPEGNEPFSVTTEIAPCPWNDDTDLLMIGLQAKKLDTREMPQSNLVFLIDVSGSMDEPKKLPLVQRSFMTLVENLDDNDKVSIVTYSSGEEVILDGESGKNKEAIMSAIESLYASGSTYGEKAINMAYDLAAKHFIKGGNNRVIMATDGDFNVGASSESELTRLIKDEAKDGVFLSILGYGMGNYKDSKLESMADNGNGNYAYIDSVDEARKVLVSEAGGTLFTVAKDVKLQVDFNPSKIKGYRLIGYENRTMAAEDFADDTKDGGEIGAGHQVIALYEIVPVDSEFEIPSVSSKYAAPSPDNNSAELLTVNIRYKEPEGDTSTLLEYPVTDENRQEEMSENMSWAAGVAQAGMLMKQSQYAGTSDIDSIRERLRNITNSDDFREEFVYLLRKWNP